MGFLDEYINQINSSTDPRALQAMPIPGMGPVDKALNPGVNAAKLEEFRANRIVQLLQQEAAPVAGEAARLKSMIANDPYIGSAEGLADFAQRPGFWLGTDNAGTVSGGKGKAPVSSAGSNPYIGQVVQNFSDQNQNILDAFKVQQQDPMAIARMSQNKEMAGGFDNATQGMERFAKRADAQTDQANLGNFLSSAAMMNTPSQRTGKMMPYGDAAALINQAAADYPVKPDVVNQATDNLLKQYINTRSPVQGKTGRTSWTGTQNLMGDVNKDVGSTAPNIRVDTGGSSKEKSPVLYLVEKPDGRTVQVDATTPEGRSRMNSAIRSGERITKLGTESVSATTVGTDGSTVSRRVSGAVAPAKTEQPAITVVRDPKTGRMVIKR
jgi:hypothetical protein